jgi:hypothetical protein
MTDVRTFFGWMLFVVAATTFARAQETRPVPPPGINIPEKDRQKLEAGVEDLGKKIESLRGFLKNNPALRDLLPDVEIYYNAVRYALTYNEFFKADEVLKAKVLLQEGQERAKALAASEAPWTRATGLVVRGYLSKIDGSVQPYGLVIPTSVAVDPLRPRRLDIWYHGRGETLSEVNFLMDREHSPGEFTPPDAIVLHPYGRYCNANRFAGEVDTFEALESVRKRYMIDENRVLIRGFSMGGAACWMFATHHSGLWAGAAPGAGFSETAGFLHIADLNSVPWYQRRLWHWYDSTDYAINLFNCPTVAYSGGIDPQKQAADAMVKALREVGIELTHVIGPNTPHRYEPHAKQEVIRRMDLIALHGRDPIPAHVKFTTWTLRYNRMLWLQLDGLEHHWERATADATIAGPSEVRITTANVTGLTLLMPSGYCPLDESQEPAVIMDGESLKAPRPGSDRSWEVHLRKIDGKWTVTASGEDDKLRKRYGVQGPIDDAFMDSFVMVRPTGKAMSEQTGNWAKTEMAHAIDRWRKQFRGEARVKDDTSITDDDLASSNLVLWGDPSSNAVLKKFAAKLPIAWEADAIRVGAQRFGADKHVLLMIYPNPLNPERYVVLNSGFTFREYDYLNNARQTPKLPDWAVIDTSTPPSSRDPGKVVDAGFFGEKWELLDNPNGHAGP